MKEFNEIANNAVKNTGSAPHLVAHRIGVSSTIMYKLLDGTYNYSLPMVLRLNKLIPNGGLVGQYFSHSNNKIRNKCELLAKEIYTTKLADVLDLDDHAKNNVIDDLTEKVLVLIKDHILTISTCTYCERFINDQCIGKTETCEYFKDSMTF